MTYLWHLRAVSSAVNGMTAIPWCSSERSQSLLSFLKRLRACQEAWCPGVPWDKEEAHSALLGKPAGSFLVLRDPKTSQPALLCVSTGEKNEGVEDYHIKCTSTDIQLCQSQLGFCDLSQLVLFYSLTRDVLAACLSIPSWIYSVTEQTQARLSQLEPKSWLYTLPDLQTECLTHKAPNTVMCTIQLTSGSRALCFINPLYLHEQGDDWLTNQPPTPLCPSQLTSKRQERRLSSTRPWEGVGLKNRRAISLDQESYTASPDISSQIRAQSADSTSFPPTPTPAAIAEVVLRQTSLGTSSNPRSRAGSQASVPATTSSTPSVSGTLASSVSELQYFSSPVPQSPHRVSWIEDGVWLAPPRPPQEPNLTELDSLSISSVEEEQETPSAGSTHNQLSAQRLADKVKHRLSAVGQVIGGLVCQEKRLTNRVVELSQRKDGTFAEAVREFIEATLREGLDPSEVTGTEFLQKVRSSLSELRDTLLDYPEIQALLDSMTDTSDSEIDSMVELSLHKVALKPISTQLYSSIHVARSHNGTLLHLQSNQRVLEGRGVEELGGSAGAGVPDPPTLEHIQQRWGRMHSAYSPSKKVQILLKVCKSIYHSMNANTSPGVVFGADDFLPCLTWVLLRSDLVTLQLDTDYMMELLDPTQLQGEGGYYLTTLYSSLYYISSFQPRLAARQLSIEAQQSINRWHRRRTLYCNQSRRTKHRQTIRRQAYKDKRNSRSSEVAAGGDQEGKSGGESDSMKMAATSDDADSQQQTVPNTEAIEKIREETKKRQGAEDESKLLASSLQHPPLGQKKLLLEDDDPQSVSRASEEAAAAKEGEKEER
ncbi:ras and Rab interactor 2 [Lampris incognitus]|uniref:ras and Rab interactor 2 n=1 Tax=Lampris incognitus TaxID=2546036 RepID=UPI0024B513FD|nr:ras and Rab interactor 2 [Lampris incognitus]